MGTSDSARWAYEHGDTYNYRSDADEQTSPTPRPDAPAEVEPLLWEGDDG